ncbi:MULTISPECIES: hypothetical protein [unclassified Rickettsia]|uniref:hypothetical protein n=1 Tax=unclassified Rickettsia TaxID=114295 RepID=UPI003132B356
MSFLAVVHGCQLKEQKHKSVIASDCKERGNPENNKFHSIFCYFFSGLPRRCYASPRNDGNFCNAFDLCNNASSQ